MQAAPAHNPFLASRPGRHRGGAVPCASAVACAEPDPSCARPVAPIALHSAKAGFFLPDAYQLCADCASSADHHLGRYMFCWPSVSAAFGLAFTPATSATASWASLGGVVASACALVGFQVAMWRDDHFRCPAPSMTFACSLCRFVGRPTRAGWLWTCALLGMGLQIMPAFFVCVVQAALAYLVVAAPGDRILLGGNLVITP